MRRPTLRSLVVGVALAEAALLLGLFLYLTLTGQTLMIRVGAPEQLVRPSPSLIIPVAGVTPAELADSYGDARGGGRRRHKGIDIFAAEGTPVRAAATGILVERSTSAAGGISLYVRDLDGVTVYYYAHLQRYRPGIKEGHLVRQGDVLGFVGHTGNVQGRAHLHFSVYRVTDPNRWWSGRDLNPYALLKPRS